MKRTYTIEQMLDALEIGIDEVANIGEHWKPATRSGVSYRAAAWKMRALAEWVRRAERSRQLHAQLKNQSRGKR